MTTVHVQSPISLRRKKRHAQRLAQSETAYPVAPTSGAHTWTLVNRESKERLGTEIDGVVAYEFPLNLFSADWIRDRWGRGSFTVNFVAEDRTPAGRKFFDLADLAEDGGGGGRLPTSSRRESSGEAASDPIGMLRTVKELAAQDANMILSATEKMTTANATMFTSMMQLFVKQSSQQSAIAPELANALNNIYGEIQALKSKVNGEDDDDPEDPDDEPEEPKTAKDIPIPTSFGEALQLAKPILQPYIPQLIKALQHSGEALVKWLTTPSGTPLPSTVVHFVPPQTAANGPASAAP